MAAIHEEGGGIMGALSDFADSCNNKQGYKIAKAIYNQYGGGLNKKEIRSHVWSDYTWDRCSFDIMYWYERLCGKDYSIFFLYERHFKTHPESIDVLKRIAAKDPNLDFIERISNDDDFFMFHPVEHSLGLELIIHNGLCPTDLNRRLRDVIVDNPDYVDGYGPFMMGW